MMTMQWSVYLIVIFMTLRGRGTCGHIIHIVKMHYFLKNHLLYSHALFRHTKYMYTEMMTKEEST